MTALKIVSHRSHIVVFPSVALGICILTKPSFPGENGDIIILSSTVTFSSIVCSFVGMSISVLIGLDTPVLKRLRSKRKVLCDFRNTLGFTFGVGLLLVGTCLVLMFVELAFAVYIWLPMVILCLASLARLSGLMLMVFSASDKPLYSD